MIDTIYNLFSVNTIFFTIFDYPMSYIEFFGTLLNIAAVYLVARNNKWNWVIGSVASVLFGLLFFQIRLYSDFFEQIYYGITGVVGWVLWNKKTENDTEKSITNTTQKTNIIYAGVIIIGTVLLGYLTANFNTWLPQYFPENASYPYLDAFTTVLSFAATILLIQKKIESWILWILVDIIGIWLYYTKGVVFVSLLYVVFLGLATQGYFKWKMLQTQNK
jgi:nicotinamide mononucleotide transporter